MHLKALLLAGAAFGLLGCVTSDDPSEGGFFNGVSGISSGTYEGRIAEREQSVDEAEARNEALATEQARLSSQISSARSELAKLKLRILNQRNAAGSLDAGTEARVQSVLNAQPAGRTQSEHLAALRKTITDAKALSADLAKLSG
ncbi:hypothetical protein [Actibacterium pelagium]|uniref:Lipoprotein n=1 Tax=Actibacterium pelagium TaxID=2029103 RepID=A0A917AIQ2_9RHOB|nr:hypothetical protein [Actibacterium pelagium]GGE51914.1 hypothetical protein GCM10011517_19540 [Actibacterium pelagium]